MGKRGLGIAASEYVERLADAAEAEELCIDASKDHRLHRLMERRVKRGGYVMPFPLAYVRASTWKRMPFTRRSRFVVRTVARRHPGWVFCLDSAAVLHGLEVSGVDPGVVHVVTSREAHTKSSPHVVRHLMDTPDIVSCNGVLATSLWQTAVTYMAWNDFRHGLVVADSVLKAAGANVNELRDRIRQERLGPLERERALCCAGWADPRSDNGGESFSRATMILLNFEVPELQVPFDDEIRPGKKHYADFCWRTDSGIVIGELDGFDKYDNEDMTQGRSVVRVMADERIRESHLTLSAARIMRFRFSDAEDMEPLRQLMEKFGIPHRMPIPVATEAVSAA